MATRHDPEADVPQGTRERILETALRLFTDQGYDGTSLREIAEELGVTKAALYYHFKTKEEIFESLAGRIMQEVSTLAEWAHQQPPGEETTDEVLSRAIDIAYGPAARVVQMVQQNQTALREIRSEGQGVRPDTEMFRGILAAMVPPEASYEEQVRAHVALISVFVSSVTGRTIDPDVSEGERRAVALRIARDLLRADRTG